MSASSQMVTFWFALQRDGAEIVCPVTIRTSGTEPKIKFYSELAAPPLPQLSRYAIPVSVQVPGHPLKSEYSTSTSRLDALVSNESKSNTY